jgi:hypothetical protein
MNSLSESTTALETLVAEYDAKVRALTAALDAVTATTAEADAIRDNTDGTATIDARSKRLAFLNAHLSILQSDAAKLQRGVDQQRQQIAKDSDELRARFVCRLNELVHDKIREVVAELKTQFDTSAFPMIEQLAETHESVAHLKQVGYFVQPSTNTDAERLQFARVVRAEVLDRIAI